ncbi:hypothetical protein [Amycolatopsis nigrescens]|uniref:hypothetical protein n=1 Tax=Amycolatopsis nigrescens TaxID=381445 RepID=UPI00037D016A|nr:hypothetical protein [Amycolatopsis nigrescens]
MPTASTTRLRWLLPVLVVVISVTVGGGLLARELYRQPGGEPEPEATVAVSTPLAPSQQPGSPTVEFTPDAAAHPQETSIRRLLQTYFDAINSRDYDRWKSTVTRQRVQAKPAEEWRDDYRTTRDGSILVYRIEPAPDRRLRVLVGFTSTQDPRYAPPELPETCIHWKLIWPLAQEGGQWKLDTLPAGSTSEATKC